MTAVSPNGHDQNALPLSPKRRMEDETVDIDSALNPAKHYPRKRVAVAVSSCQSCHTLETDRDTRSAKSADYGRQNVTRNDLAASVQMLA